jgi:WD40 repeat protein
VGRYCLKILISSLLILPGCSKSTKPEFHRSPDLTFLAKAHPTPEGVGFYDCSFPVWSPDGNKIYYIENSGEWCSREGHKVNIWVVDTNGENAHEVKEGKYMFLSISPSGEKLAAISRNYDSPGIGGDVVVFGSDGSGEQTIFTSGPDSSALDVKFLPGEEEKLIYYAVFVSENSITEYRVYSYNLKDSTTILLFKEKDSGVFAGFDVHGNEIVRSFSVHTKIIILDDFKERLDVRGVRPKFSPDGNKIITAPLFSLFDANSGVLISKLDVQTHCNSIADFPSWSPDGKKIVFVTSPDYNSVGHETPPLPDVKPEVWILNNVQ